MLLDTSFLNTQHYKVRIKGKVEQDRERGSGVVTIEKEAFLSPSTTVANFTSVYSVHNILHQILKMYHQ